MDVHVRVKRRISQSSAIVAVLCQTEQSVGGQVDLVIDTAGCRTAHLTDDSIRLTERSNLLLITLELSTDSVLEI